MIRRKLTLKRVDPWSVLKFGFVVNLALLLVLLLGAWILWIVIGRLGIIETFCDSIGSIVLDLQECSLNGGNLFRTLVFLGLLGVVVQTGIVVFGAFLYNLISDLTGGLAFTFLDESGDATLTSARAADRAAATGSAAGTSGGVGGTGTASAGTGTRTGQVGSTGPRPTPSTGTGQRTAPPDDVASARSTPRTSPSSAPSRDQDPPSPPSSARRADGSLWGDPTRRND